MIAEDVVLLVPELLVSVVPVVSSFSLHEDIVSKIAYKKQESKLKLGKDIILEITQIGKECHTRCAIYQTVGDCVMPREGIFAKVIQGGNLSVDDIIEFME